MTAIEEIAAERKRQIEVEGFDPDRDDLIHSNGGLAYAALAYTAHATAAAGLMDSKSKKQMKIYTDTPAPKYWPWHKFWWKPKSPRRDLIRAAALIVAEIERMDRVVAKDGAP